jgi:hypothetical protein
MKKFDILSQPPRTYIFERYSNKTIFGGVLSIIYLLIMIFISIYYIYNYIIGDKYEYYYSYRELPEEQKKKAFAGFDPNPPIHIKLDAINELDWNISSNLKFIYYTKDSEKKIIYRNDWTEITIPDYAIIDLYYSIDDINDIKEIEFGENFEVNLTYKTFYLDHQNPVCPFKKIVIYKYLRFNFEKNFILYMNWEFTKYKEKNDIFKIFSNYLRRPIQFLDGRLTINDLKEEKNDGEYNNEYIIDGVIHKYLGSIVIFNSRDTIHEYLRQKREWLSVLATISALANSFYSIFVRFFYFIYSKKYDQYKIFKNILLLDAKIKKSDSIFLSEASNLKLNNFSLEKKVEKALEVREIQVINSNKNDSCSSTNNNDKGSECPTTEKEEKDEEVDNNNLHLPKMPFVNFIFNNLFIDKCSNSNKQKLINLSSKIIYKYYSIENILYNQIKFENLLNDYKWNNPKLKNVQNNKTILEIRSNLQI